MGVTVLHLLEQRVQEPGHVGVRITVDGDQVLIEDLREQEPVSAHGTVDEAGLPFAEGLARMLAPLRLSAESLVDAPLSGPVDFADAARHRRRRPARPHAACGRRAANAPSCACRSASATPASRCSST